MTSRHLYVIFQLIYKVNDYIITPFLPINLDGSSHNKKYIIATL